MFAGLAIGEAGVFLWRITLCGADPENHSQRGYLAPLPVSGRGQRQFQAPRSKPRVLCTHRLDCVGCFSGA